MLLMERLINHIYVSMCRVITDEILSANKSRKLYSFMLEISIFLYREIKFVSYIVRDKVWKNDGVHLTDWRIMKISEAA